MNPFWIAAAPLVLASGSAARRQLLEAALIPLEVVPAAIDERAVEAPLLSGGAGPTAIARHLAEAKAVAVSRTRPARLVLGADQTLALAGRMFTKAGGLAEARGVLETLSGQTHRLHSGWALARDGVVIEAGVAVAGMTMRALGSDFLGRYIASEGEALLSTVGAYRLEGPGLHLFDRIDGDHGTILGLPMMAVLPALRRCGALLG